MNNGDSEYQDREGLEILQLTGPIAFQRVFVTWTDGSINAALMLSQLVFWTRMTYWGKWIYKTSDQWYEELGISKKMQQLARMKLREIGLVEEKRVGIPPKLYFRLHEKNYRDRIKSISTQRGMSKRPDRDPTDGPKGTSRRTPKGPYNTEITSETTSRNGADAPFIPLGENSTKDSLSMKLSKEFESFLIAKRLGFINPKTNKRKKADLSQWSRACQNTIEAMDGDSQRFKTVMRWYFENHRNAWMPVCRAMTTFCEHFESIEHNMHRENKNASPPKRIRDIPSEEWEREFGEEAS